MGFKRTTHIQYREDNTVIPNKEPVFSKDEGIEAAREALKQAEMQKRVQERQAPADGTKEDGNLEGGNKAVEESEGEKGVVTDESKAKKEALEIIKVNDGYSSLSQQKTAAIGGVDGQLEQCNITNDDKSKVIDLVWQSFNADKLREKSSDMKTKFDGVKTQYNLASSQCPWNADADQLKKSNCQQFQDDAGKAFHFASKDLITEYIQLMEKNSGVGDGVEDKACKHKQNDSEFGLNYQYKVEVCKDIKKNNPIKTVVGNMDGIGKTGDQRSVGYEWLKTETSNKAKEVVHGKSMNIKQIATEFCGNSGSIGEASFAATDAYQDMCDLTALKTEFSVYIDSLET